MDVRSPGPLRRERERMSPLVAAASSSPRHRGTHLPADYQSPRDARVERDREREREPSIAGEARGAARKRKGHKNGVGGQFASRLGQTSSGGVGTLASRIQ